MEPEEIQTYPLERTAENQMEARIHEVFDLLIIGYSPFQIWRKKEEWKISLRQVQNYVKECKERIQRQNKVDFNEIRTNHTLFVKWLLKQFVERDDLRGALVAEARLGELEGVKEGNIFPLSPQEEEKRLISIKHKLFEINPKLIQRPEGKSEFEVKNG